MDLRGCIDQLNRGATAIAELAGDTIPEDAAWKPDADRWSVLEVVNHLTDVEVEDFRTDANLILFDPDKTWPNFDIFEWVTSRSYNDRELSVSIAAFQEERRQSICWLEALKEFDLNASHSGNGFSRKPMRFGDVLASWVAHDLFHVRQLALLKWDILNRNSSPFSPAYSGFET